MSPPSFDWLGFLISLYCRVDFSHNISPNLSSFQTQLIQWQRVCRQVQCDSAWFFHQPWNITKRVQVMKKHLTQHIFTNNLSIFLYFKIQLFADSFISFLQNFEKKFHISTYHPKVLTLSWERANKLVICGHIMTCLVSLYL